MSFKSPPFKSIAIIGAGPSGLACAKALIGEKFFSKIKIFERQEQSGGVWAYRPETRNTPLVPSVDAFVREPTFLDDKQKKPLYFSPMYKSLETNIPNHIMRYNNHHFSEKLPLFPSRSDVLKYVQDYAKPVTPYIRYNSEVQSLLKNEEGKWSVKFVDYTENYPTGQEYAEEFEAVIISTGHYDLPFLPNVEGIEQWNKKYPGSVQHSKYFDDPADYKDQNVLVIGNSASGLDISMQVAQYAKKVYRSIASASQMPYVDDPRITDVPKIKSYDTEGKTILLDESQEGFDNKITSLKDIDTIIYCTGYLYSFPFLKSYTNPKDPEAVINSSGKRLHRLYRHSFYIPDPSLSFVCMNRFIVPFPLAETQGAAIARYYSGRLSLPSKEEMLTQEKEIEQQRGTGTEYHDLPFPDDVIFYRSIQEWTKNETKDTPTLKKDEGFQPEEWTDARLDQRKEAFSLKEQALKQKIAKVLENSQQK